MAFEKTKYNNKFPDGWEWAGNKTIEGYDTEGGKYQPPDELKEQGFTPGYKPPAEFFNWFWRKVIKCVREIQTLFKSHRDAAVLDHPDESVTAEKIAPNAVIEEKIFPGAVTETKIAPGSVTNEKIGPDAITREKIKDGEIIESKIAPRAVTNEKIGPDAITNEKIADEAVGRENLTSALKSEIDGKAPINHSHGDDEITDVDASKIKSGVIDVARIPLMALERLTYVANKEARFALTKNIVQKGDTVKEMDTGLMFYVVDDDHLDSDEGYEEYTAGRAASVEWTGIIGKPNEFMPIAHASTDSKFGSGNGTYFGHVKLTDISSSFEIDPDYYDDIIGNNRDGDRYDSSSGVAVSPFGVVVLARYEVERTTQGTWTNPFIVSDPETDLSTLTTPGIYYFDFEEEVYAITEPYDFGCYTNGYMQVAGLWNKQHSETAVGQTLYVYNEDQFYSCTRKVGPKVAENWRVSAWVTDITKIDLDGRVKALENAKGTWAKPYIISQSETRLSTLINPGVYRFMIDDTAATELKGRGFYRGGYMEVAPVWGDNTGGLIYFQKIYTGFEGKVWIYTRTIQGKGVEENDDGWQMVETSSANLYAAGPEDKYLPSLEKRVAALEKAIKSLTGGTDDGTIDENTTLTAATDADAENVLKKYFS